MADWDESSPADNDIVSQFPANERAARLAGKTNFGVDHHEANDANVGKHEVVQVMDNAADPTITAGEVGIWNNGGKLNTRVGAAAVSRVINLVSGTKMLFFQAAAPTGWTQDVTINDRVLRMVSGAGGGTGGSWTISGISVDSHTLTVAEMPAHDHGGGGNTGTNGSHDHTGTALSAGSHNHSVSKSNGSSGGSSGGVAITVGSSFNTSTAGAHTHSLSIDSNGSHLHTYSIPSQGGGGGHTHNLTIGSAWRPSYVDIIAATLD